MLKIVATISDFGAAANIGGDTERESFIIEVPTKNIPEPLKEFLNRSADEKQWQTLSLSILNENL